METSVKVSAIDFISSSGSLVYREKNKLLLSYKEIHIQVTVKDWGYC